MSLTLVIGGTRSGKSAYAERLAGVSRGAVRYLATGDPADESLRRRIDEHVARRPPQWETLVVGDDLAGSVLPDAVCLLDSLGGWIARALPRGVDVAEQVKRLIANADDCELIVVAEQAGDGLLPLDPVARAWLDHLGQATQALSAAAQRVDVVIAGRPLRLGGPACSAPVSLRRHGDLEVAPGETDHAVNVLEPGPPQWLRAALSDVLRDGARRYPREDQAAAATATLHGRQSREIVPTNGAAEALWLLGPALRPRLAACVHPGFTEVDAGLHAHDVPVARVLRNPDEDFRLQPGTVPEDADLVVVGNPASPSGTLEPAATLLALRRPGRTVVVDEAFMGMVPGEPASLAAVPLDDVIVVRSLTKVLSIPGVRAGYAIAPPRLADALRAVRPPWSASALALGAMTAASAHPVELAGLARRAEAERADLERRLGALAGIRTWPSATNFCLIEVPHGHSVVAGLRRRRLAVRPAASFPGLGAGHLRITARDPERNARLVAALGEVLS